MNSSNNKITYKIKSNPKKMVNISIVRPNLSNKNTTLKNNSLENEE